MNKYKLLIFDIDGTLFDTSEGIISSVKFALEKNNLSLDEGFNYQVFIGPPIQLSIKNLFPHLGEDEVKKVALDFRNHYKDHDLFKATPYPFLYEALDYIQECGIQLAVATYKREDYAFDIAKHFKVCDYTSLVFGQDFDGKRSKKDIIELAIEQSGFAKQECLMIGDTSSDADAAAACGVDFLEVDFGFGFTLEKHYEGPSIGWINGYEELIQMVKGWQK